ncbi:MAG: flavodoxin family protein [Halanaerobiales bacterium]|nr:flavodoxin family protein [Halanaerobiales bacterium]MCF8008312.1 flavodoxin family protein [Halanaerobiales bacterium]
MNTLILFGSARNNANTKTMVNIFSESLKGEIELINAYRSEVSPCIDCKYCWENSGCSIDDKMQSIYKKIDQADNIVFASPLYFNCIPGPLKNIVDRCQVYWAAVKRDEITEKNKKAVLLLCGGAPPYNKQFKAAEIVLEGVLKDIKAEVVDKVFIPNTDKVTVDDNKNGKLQLKEASLLLNK